MPANANLCICHGESTFDRAWRTAPLKPLLFAAPLSEVGHERVRQARPTLVDAPVEIMITSPLTRTLQTALGLVSGHPRAPQVLVSDRRAVASPHRMKPR